MKKYMLCIFPVVFCLIFTTVVFSASGPEVRKRVEKWDKKNIRHATGVVTDTSKEFIKIPEGYQGPMDFAVAKKAPTIDFTPVRGLHPEFFPEDSKGQWTQWGEVTQGPNGCFYMAVGDHVSKDSHVFIIEYDPVKKDQRIVVNVGKTCGWKTGLHTDGKIHGRMDIMPDGTLVAATWRGSVVTDEDIAHGWLGGHMLTYNVLTGKTEYLGIPMLNYSWHYHVTDTQTGVFMAVGDGYTALNYRAPKGKGMAFLAYDVINRKTIFAGMPPDGIGLNPRATLLDERTGMFYSTDIAKDNTFFCYNYRTNRFRHLACKVPPHPVTGETNVLRAYTEYSTPDNLFYCMDLRGGMFKFYPGEERTESMGIVNFGSEGIYVASMSFSPKLRYIYYTSAKGIGIKKLGTPVVQFDTKTNQKKVIAFLGPYYHKKYGYAHWGSYGNELSKDGSFLVICMNGGWGPEVENEYIDQPAIYVVHIPESERLE